MERFGRIAGMKLSLGLIMSGTILAFGPVSSFGFQVAEKSGVVSLQNASGRQTCETGVAARAQLDLGDGSVIRLGANTVLRSDESDTTVSLLKGTALFDFNRRSQSLLLKHSGKQISVSGGSCFARFAEDETSQGKVLLVGALANKVTATMDGKSLRLRPGQLIAFDAQGKSLASYFNLAKLAENGALLKEFQSPLPARAAIQREVKNYVSLQKRGFIRSNNGVNTEQLLAGRNVLPTETGQLALATPNSGNDSSLNSASLGSASALGESRYVSFTVEERASASPGSASALRGSIALTAGNAGTLTPSSSMTLARAHGNSLAVSAVQLTSTGSDALILSRDNLSSGGTQVILFEAQRDRFRNNVAFPSLPPTPITPPP